MESRNPIATDWIHIDAACELILPGGKPVCRRTVREWCNKGILEWTKLGGAVLIRRSSIQRRLDDTARGGNISKRGP